MVKTSYWLTWAASVATYCPGRSNERWRMVYSKSLLKVWSAHRSLGPNPVQSTNITRSREDMYISPLKSTPAPFMSPKGCAGVGACNAQGDEYAACGVAVPTIQGTYILWLFWPQRKWKSWQCNSGMKSKARFKDNYCSTLHRIRSCFWNEFPKVWFQQIQSSAKRLRPGLVNFVCAVACHSCLSLPAAFTQPGQSILADPCKANNPNQLFAVESRNRLTSTRRDGGQGVREQYPRKWDEFGEVCDARNVPSRLSPPLTLLPASLLCRPPQPENGVNSIHCFWKNHDKFLFKPSLANSTSPVIPRK